MILGPGVDIQDETITRRVSFDKKAETQLNSLTVKTRQEKNRTN